MTLQAEAGLQTVEVDACPACGSAHQASTIENVRDWYFDCVAGEWSFTECGDCGSLYLNPRLTTDDLPKAYSRYYTHTAKPANQSGNRDGLYKKLVNSITNARFGTSLTPSFELLSQIKPVGHLTPTRIAQRYRYFPRLKPGARILDVGCGSGGFLRLANLSGWSAFGVDFDDIAVQEAKAEGLSVVHGSVDAARTFGHKFDAISLSHVIEHVPDIQGTLAVCFEILEDQGFIYLEFPNPQCDSRRKFGRYWRGLEAPRHLCIPSKTAIQNILQNIGFHGISFVDNHGETRGVDAASAEVADAHGHAIEGFTRISPEEPSFVRVTGWK